MFLQCCLSPALRVDTVSCCTQSISHTAVALDLSTDLALGVHLRNVALASLHPVQVSCKHGAACPCDFFKVGDILLRLTSALVMHRHIFRNEGFHIRSASGREADRGRLCWNFEPCTGCPVKGGYRSPLCLLVVQLLHCCCELCSLCEHWRSQLGLRQHELK